MRPIEVRFLGKGLPYAATQEAQKRAADALRRGELCDQLWVLQHEPVITVPRKEKAWANLLVTAQRAAELGVAIETTTRGGNITYHGPGQVVVYPIVHLQPGERDVRKFVCNLEEAMMDVSRAYGLSPQRSEGQTGTWIGDEKIGAIGVRFSRWVSTHGISYNGRTKMSDFELIVPCGLVDKGVCSLHGLGVETSDAELEERLARAVVERLGRAYTSAPSRLP